LQRKLYGKAKSERNFRFCLRYDKVWRTDILHHAFQLARANKGAPGVDAITFEQIEASGLEDGLTRLGEELRAKTYQCQPVRRVMIPKPGGPNGPPVSFWPQMGHGHAVLPNSGGNNGTRHHRNGVTGVITRRQMTGSTGALLLSGLLAACVTRSAYDQLNQQLSAEIAQGQVHITRLQGAIKVTVNSELLFPSGGWQMPPGAAKTIAEMAPVLAPMQTAHILSRRSRNQKV
jgi:hypothetical protein